MKKRTINAIIPTLEAAGANIVDDTIGLYWSVMKASADATALMTFQYGKVVSYNYIASQAEVLQLVTIGASTSKETIVASTRYAINISNNQQDYETHRQHPIIHAYTSAATLSGTAATDRATVYNALVSKINSYANNNVSASALSYVAYTLGTSTGNAATNFIIGETVTQETSGITAKVALCTVVTGTFYDDNAAGHLWLYDISAVASWDAGTKTWTAAGTVAGVSTNCVVTGTAASQIHSTGLAIVDDAGYFISKIGRGGANYVGIRSGFATDTVVVGRAAVYSIGIGTTMLAQKPLYDHAKQDLLSGDMEFEFQDGNLPVAGATYRKYIIVTKDGDEDSVGASLEESLTEHILYAQEDSGLTNLGTFHSALAAAAVK
jgi:hypothetical protein